MPFPIKTQVVRDTATPALKSIIRSVSPARPLLRALATRMTSDLKEHFRMKEAEPSRRGWPKGHFWSKVRNSTHIGPVSDTEASVIISDPRFAMRYYGGTILPKEKKNLAVPLTAEAANKYPSSGLIPGVFLTFRRVAGQLKQFLVTGDKDKPEGQVFLWVLKKSVEHPKDPTALPTDAKINASLLDEAGKFVERAQRRATA